MNMTISQWLDALVPMSQIVGIVDQVLPAFVLVAVMILLIGYSIAIIGSETVFAPSSRLIVLCACIAGAPWMLSIGQGIANALVGSIADAAQPTANVAMATRGIPAGSGLNWLVVNNPNSASLALDFEKPFGIISQYVAGKTGATPAWSFWELNKWADYLMRAIFILLTGLVACVTVFIMQAMLVIQKLIMVFSKLAVPLFIACLSLPAAQGSAQDFLKSVFGVMCWPVGWAIVHVGTMAALLALQPPNANASLGELILGFATLAVVCLWPVVGTIGAPVLIAKMVTSGTNFAHSMVGGFASTAGQHVSRTLPAAGAVTGASVGGVAGGAAGAATGALVGAQTGSILALPLTSATESAEGVNEGRRAIPSSRSAGVADAAIGLIKARS